MDKLDKGQVRCLDHNVIRRKLMGFTSPKTQWWGWHFSHPAPGIYVNQSGATRRSWVGGGHSHLFGVGNPTVVQQQFWTWPRWGQAGPVRTLGQPGLKSESWAHFIFWIFCIGFDIDVSCDTYLIGLQLYVLCVCCLDWLFQQWKDHT